jgi:hypothetical protein
VLQLWRPDLLNANHSINRVNGSLLSYYTHFIKHLRQVNSRIVGFVFSMNFSDKVKMLNIKKMVFKGT